jgi:ABC-type transport system involved in multi-copper enzyme maturation permease subunit
VTAPAPAPASAPVARPVRPGGGPRFGNLIRAELTKIRTVRSTVWSLALLVILTIGFTVLIAALTAANWDKADPTTKAQFIGDPVPAILGGGLEFGQLTICVLGVLVLSGEYTTGMIRSSLLAVPRRWPMLVAKAVSFGGLILVIGEIVSFVSFLAGAALLNSKVPVSLGDPGVLRAVAGGGLYLAMLGLFAMAVAGLIRHTAGAITAVIGFVLVLAPLAQLIPDPAGKYIHAYLPTEAGQLIVQIHRASGDVLTPWQGFAVFGGWTLLLLLLAGLALQRRDA